MAFKIAELLVDLSLGLLLLLIEACQILNSFFHPQNLPGLFKDWFVLFTTYGSCMYLRVNKKNFVKL